MGQTRRAILKFGWAIGAAVLVSRSVQGRGDDPPRSGTQRPTPRGRTPEEQQWEAWWADLEKGEEDASRALLAMSDHPAQAVAFLKEKMKPLTITPERVNDLLNWLGSEDENVWMTAFEEFEYYDPRLAIGLEALMVKVTQAPTRQRMVEVLSERKPGTLAGKEVNIRQNAARGSFNFFTRPGGSWWAESKVSELNGLPGGNRKKKWTRAVRAIVLLEHIGTPEAVAILKSMAAGHTEAQPTRAAKTALSRMEAKSEPTRP